MTTPPNFHRNNGSVKSSPGGGDLEHRCQGDSGGLRCPGFAQYSLLTLVSTPSGIKTLVCAVEGIGVCNLCNMGYLTVYYWLTPWDKSVTFAELHPASSVAKWGGCAWQMVFIITVVNSTDTHESHRFSFTVLALPLPKWLWTSKCNSLSLNCLIGKTG